jgi:hypothetical protein
MIPVGNDDFAVGRIAHQKERRRGLAFGNFALVFLYVRIADAEERQAGGSEDVLGFDSEMGARRSFLRRPLISALP